MVVCSYVTSLYFLSLRSLCAFLNSGKCGTVYLGIRKDGVVCGVNVGRKEVHLVSLFYCGLPNVCARSRSLSFSLCPRALLPRAMSPDRATLAGEAGW